MKKSSPWTVTISDCKGPGSIFVWSTFISAVSLCVICSCLYVCIHGCRDQWRKPIKCQTGVIFLWLSKQPALCLYLLLLVDLRKTTWWPHIATPIWWPLWFILFTITLPVLSLFETVIFKKAMQDGELDKKWIVNQRLLEQSYTLSKADTVTAQF